MSMVRFANRVAALVVAMMTCVFLMARMLYEMPPLQSIRSALFSALSLGALTWLVTLIGASVVSEAARNDGTDTQTTGERNTE
jgi:hypothetical protein